MGIAVILIILGVISGWTEAAGLLPHDLLHAAVGDTIKFNTTLTPTAVPFVSVGWNFGDINIITSNTVNLTVPEYEGRITFFPTTGSLELRNLSLSDSGDYRVAIIPSGEQQRVGNTRLDVQVPVSNITVTTSSTDLVEFNSTAWLSCSSSGSSLSFLWMNGSSQVTETDRVQLTDGGSTLTIVNVTRSDDGPFTCQVSNSVSSGTSDPVNLSISFGPENMVLTSPSQDNYYAEGSDIVLSCSAGSRPLAQFSWFLNGAKLPDAGPELRMMNIQRNQSGNYSCQAFNIRTLRYETSRPSVVSVLERISGASVTPSTNLQVEENPLNLTCEAAGSVFDRTWKKDGLNLSLADHMKTYEEDRVLSFISLKKTDSGEYSCQISNPVSTEEVRYTVDVKYGPENVLITGPSEIHFQQSLILNCSAESKPSATYSWILNGTEIHNSSVFSKDNTESSDSGSYTCRATNDVTGRTSSAVHGLTVTAIPDPPPGCSAGCIAGIVIACLAVLGGAACGGYFIYKTKINNKSQKQSENKGVEEHVYEEATVYENL